MEVFFVIFISCAITIAFCGLVYFLKEMFTYDFWEPFPFVLLCLFLVIVWGCALYSGYKEKDKPKEILVVRCLKND